EAPSLQQQYGDMFADMEATLPWLGELVVKADLSSEGDGWEGATLAANWKVLAENCLECYHCGPAHPDLVDLIDMKTYSCVTHGDWLKSHGKIKKAENSAYNVDPNEPVQEAIFWHMWPNIEFSILPGSKAIGAFRFNPMDAENTAMNSIMLTVPGESIAPDRLTYRWDVLWPEDKTLCMSVHKGLKSKGYRQGRFVTDPDHLDVSEHAVHYFQQLYARAMEI
ncbi:MAG: SRPBCC family protein, partial [Pseudomonadota bacterium]